MKKPNGKKGEEERRRVWLYYQEKLIKHSDISNTLISNDRARNVLGTMMRLEPFIQCTILSILEEEKLIKRIDKREIGILRS